MSGTDAQNGLDIHFNNHLNKAEILLHDINTKDSGVLYHFYTIIRYSLEKFLLFELCSAKM